jgi:hypothetical protein
MAAAALLRAAARHWARALYPSLSRSVPTGEGREEIVRLQGQLTSARASEALLKDIVRYESEIARHAPEARQGELLVSIVMPVRDRPALVLDAIASVLAQSWRAFELIIVDDGSAQDVAALVAQRFTDPRICVIRQAPAGVSAARNTALRHAQGDLIAYLDSDNIWLPEFLASMARGFSHQPALDCAYGILLSMSHQRDNGLMWDHFDRAELERANFIDLNVFVHRRTLYERLGGFDESLHRLVDWDLILRYAADRPPGRIPAWGAIYRVVDDARISDVVPLAPSLARIRSKQVSPRSEGVSVGGPVGFSELAMLTGHSQELEITGDAQCQ